ncbi:emp24p/erv25p- protein [Malassezia vespertilionis]|uniref:Erp1p n=1 Tax=Malassezia vespertilionis TaxID=2020962 RepID=A0A2N1J8P4_9BASI|nr:emp24p/erv25p- protein [Malassezia vespertilionis]PKI82927.1 Erp1p [Malassezia vespertilionis]WFD08260.1 emp24p/erv25p- protein [Malassezia vespertilionis]
MRVLWVWFVALCMLTRGAACLYMYFEAGEVKCFYEQLPLDTIVVGHYFTEEWDDAHNQYDIPTELGIGIVVRHTPTNHILVSAHGKPAGKFALTTHEAGMHEICLQTEYHGARLKNGHFPELRMHIDIVIGDAHRSTSAQDKVHSDDLLSRARALNAKMRDLHKEQQYQREREMSFRDLSEATNTRAAWFMVFQFLVLVIACIWQLLNLRTFFEDKKLR